MNVPLNIQNDKLNTLETNPDVDIIIMTIEYTCFNSIVLQHTKTDCARFYDGYFKLKYEGRQCIEVALLVSQAIYKEDPVKFLRYVSINFYGITPNR